MFFVHKMLCVGEIVNTHGVRGELKVVPLTDEPDELLDYNHFFIEDKDYKVSNIRFHKEFALVSLDGINDMNIAEGFKGKFLELPREELKPLSDGRYYICDLIGLKVIDVTLGVLGTINEVINTPGNDVYVVEYNGKPLCIPVLDGVVNDVNLEKGEMIITLPKGLI